MRLAVYFAVLGWVLLAASPARGQVRCLSSFPAPGSHLEEAPNRVILWMSEPVALPLSRFQVTDPHGRRFDGPPQVSADGLRVEIPLQPLPRGVFVVHYSAASILTGHVSSGLFTFGVRTPPPRPEASAGVWALRAAGAIFTLGAVATGSSGGAALATATAVAEWVHTASSAMSVPLSTLLRSSLAGVLLGGTQPGWASLLATATTAVWLIPTLPSANLVRTAAALWVLFVLPLVAAAGGPLNLVATSHAPALLLMMGVYGVAGLLAALALPVFGVRIQEPRWTRLVLGVLLAAAWALRSARGLGEFFTAWTALSLGCAVAYAWGERRAHQIARG